MPLLYLFKRAKKKSLLAVVALKDGGNGNEENYF